MGTRGSHTLTRVPGLGFKWCLRVLKKLARWYPGDSAVGVSTGQHGRSQHDVALTVRQQTRCRKSARRVCHVRFGCYVESTSTEAL